MFYCFGVGGGAFWKEIKETRKLEKAISDILDNLHKTTTTKKKPDFFPWYFTVFLQKPVLL